MGSISHSFRDSSPKRTLRRCLAHESHLPQQPWKTKALCACSFAFDTKSTNVWTNDAVIWTNVWTNHGNLLSAPALPYIFAGQQQVTRFSLSKMVLDPLNQIIFEDVEYCWIAGAKDAATSTTRLSPQLLSDSKILNRCVFELQSCMAFSLCMGECSSFQIGSSENRVPSNSIVHHNVHHYCHFVVFAIFSNLNHCWTKIDPTAQLRHVFLAQQLRTACSAKPSMTWLGPRCRWNGKKRYFKNLKNSIQSLGFRFWFLISWFHLSKMVWTQPRHFEGHDSVFCVTEADVKTIWIRQPDSFKKAHETSCDEDTGIHGPSIWCIEELAYKVLYGSVWCHAFKIFNTGYRY